MANEIKIKASVDSKQAEAALGRTAAGVKSVKAASVGGTGAWTAYTGAMKAATVAVRGFFSALGVIGAVMGGINMVISLWKNLSDHLRGPAVRAAEEAKKRAEELKQAEEDAAKAAQERFEKATEAAREYIKVLKEAAALEASKLSDRSKIRSANTTEANANIDRQVATGELDRTAASAQKRMNSLLARQADLEDARRTAQNNLDAVRAARDSKSKDYDRADENVMQKAEASVAADEAFQDYVGKHTAGRAGVGLLAAQEESRIKESLGNKSALAYKDYEEAVAERDALNVELEAIEQHFAEVSSETARNLEVLNAELAANAAEMAAAEAEFEALAAKERAATLESVGKEAAEEANKALDSQAASGVISQGQANAQKAVNQIQEQIAALERAREGEEVGGFQWDSAWIEKAMSDLQDHLAEALENVELENKKAEKTSQIQTETVKPMVDAWTKIGAFTGNGANNAGVEVAKRHLQVSQKHLTLAEKSNARLQQLVNQISKLKETTT